MPVMVKIKQRKIFNYKISHLVDEELIPKMTQLGSNSCPCLPPDGSIGPRQLLSNKKSQNY
jgi:hypothetical protein